VKGGKEPISRAHRKAQTEQSDSESRGSRQETLRIANPTLAEDVKLGRLNLEEAEQRNQDQHKRKQDRVLQTSRHLASVLNYLDPENVPCETAARSWLEANELATTPVDDFSLPRLHRTLAVFQRYVELREEQDEPEEE
jgi:hypothetical protein